MFSKPDLTDRLVQATVAAIAAFALLNGLFMLVDPFGWYEAVGTVKATGPANPHFIKDIGIAYIVSAALLGYGAANPALRWGSVVVGTSWLAAHGVLHIYEVMAGICSPDIFWRDAPGVLGLPLLALIAIGVQLARRRISCVPLPKSIFTSLGKQMLGESGAYLDDVAATGGFATESMQHAMVLAAHRYHAPADMAHMARLGSTRAEDCGPCVEIARNFALSEGMEPNRLQSALKGKPENARDALAYDFGSAIAGGDDARAAELGDTIEARHGRKVRTELALAAAVSRLYPALKRGLGYASPCTIPRA